MTEFPILRDLGYVVVVAATLLVATRPLRVPPILAYILGGLLLGPVLHLLAVSESIDLFSHLGIALLLFVVGLELSVDKIRDVGGAAATVGALQVVSTVVLGAGLSLLLGFDPVDAIFLGLAVAFSSTVVVVKLLDRAGALGALYGRVSIGILLVQDVLVAVVLTLVAGLSTGGGTDVAAIGAGLARAFLGLAAIALVAAAAARWVLPRVFAWLSESTEALFIASLTWAFAAILAAELLHVSIELGAFVAGVALAQLPYNEELRRRVHPLVDFFLAVFFVALGAGMDLGAALRWWPAAIVLSLFVLIAKPLLIAWLLARADYSGRSAFLAGVTLGQVSEFAFILLGIAVSAGLVEDALLSLVGLLGLVTIGASAVLAPRAGRLYDRLPRRLLPPVLWREGEEEPAVGGREGHVVIVGMNTLGRRLAERFLEMGERVLAIDTDPRKLGQLPVDVVLGSADNPVVLDEAGIGRAKLVVSALQIEDANSMLAYRCNQLGVPVSIHAFDPTLAHELLEIGADHLMISKHDGIRLMQSEFRRLGALG